MSDASDLPCITEEILSTCACIGATFEANLTMVFRTTIQRKKKESRFVLERPRDREMELHTSEQ